MLTDFGSSGLLAVLAAGCDIGGFIGLNGWLPFNAQIARCGGLKELGEFFKGILHLDVAATFQERLRIDWYGGVFGAYR